MRIRPVTMLDVAERAQVSKVAVSVVLHGSRSSTRVAETTRQRILQAAQDLHYTPNGLARALRSRQTNIIGLYLGDRYTDLDTHRSLFISEVVSGLQRGCNEHHKDLLIHGTFRGQSISDIHTELLGGKIDGLVMFATEEDPLVLRLASSALPVIAIADAVPNLPSVVVDDADGSIKLARYLAEKGHKRVLFRNGLKTQSSPIRRRAAFCATAESLGMSVIEDLTPDARADEPLSKWEEALLASSDRPTAVACYRDGQAYYTVDFCQKIGLRVPDDISVVGFDGIVPEMRPYTDLTTIRAPWAEVARTAVELLAKRFDGADIPQETVLPVEFVQGATA